MTIREIEEKILAHLDAQGVRSAGNGCLYRGPSGTKCAAGVLIDDGHYSESLELKGVEDVSVWYALVASGVPDTPVAREVIGRWQLRHDDPGNWDEAGYIGPRGFIGGE